MKHTLCVLLTVASLPAFSTSNADFDKVQWNYEIFNDGMDKEPFDVSILKGSPEGKPFKGESVKIPLENIECDVTPGQIHEKTLEVYRGFSCMDKSNESFSQSLWVGCGPSKIADSATIFINGNHCDKTKKCYPKSYKVIFSCLTKK
jgi:hypothetical protein